MRDDTLDNMSMILTLSTSSVSFGAYMGVYVMPSIQLMILRRYKIAVIHLDFEHVE